MALKKAGLTDLRWHDLRHEYASRLAERGVALSKVRDLLGHASITTTERYDNQMLASLRDAARMLEDGKTFQNLSSSESSKQKPGDELVDEDADNSLSEEDLEIGGPRGDRTHDTVMKSFPCATFHGVAGRVA
jgi:Phage integrase family